MNCKRLVNDRFGMFDTSTKKKRLAGAILLGIILALFLAFNRFPKLEIVQEDLEAVSGPQVECFQGFCIEDEPDSTFLSRWWDFSLTYLRLVAGGMIFAFLVAGLTEAFLFPQAGFQQGGFSQAGGTWLSRGGILAGTLKGLGVGPVWNLCSACIVPVTAAFRRRGAGIAGTVAMVQGSSTLNLPGIVMALVVFTPLLGGSRIALSLLGGLLIGPLVALVAGEKRERGDESEVTAPFQEDAVAWRKALAEGAVAWAKSTGGYLLRMGPIMVIAGFASGLAIQWLSPDTVERYLGNDIQGVAIAATLGILINVPLLFEIPLVVLLLLLGMGTAPAATLLFTAAAGGPITFWGLTKLMPRRAIATFASATWGVGLIGGIAVFAISAISPGTEFGIRASVISDPDGGEGTQPIARPVTEAPNRENLGPTDGAPSVASRIVPSTAADRRALDNGREQLSFDAPVTPFTNVASKVYPFAFMVWNNRPGAVIFDYDRDGDLDIYITAQTGFANQLYRNEGDATFVEVAVDAGVAATKSNSTGAMACDVNNDGFQDLYVGARGLHGDNLDYRSAVGQGNTARNLREVTKDRLFVNRGAGTFAEVTDQAFGDDLNLRSAGSIACADVDGDGWLDIYVGNLIDEEYLLFRSAAHPGHYNVLYRNNGDLTFQEIAESAGVLGPQIRMRDPEGQALMFEDPETGREFEGYNPPAQDDAGNQIGDPTGPTHAVLFFDYDDDGDPDLWVANDGDRLHVYRNDSSPGRVTFTPVAREMGIDRNGQWMGFAVGDYDGDVDLDVFVTNVGYHLRLGPPQAEPGGDCKYQERFDWGTCLHFLLRNQGTREVPGLGTVGDFQDVAESTVVVPSPLMPPDSLDPGNINPSWEVPVGLAAYDFGYGATFFDFDNDGDEDLYWLGSELDRGEGPRGHVFPAAGRMLRGNGVGLFEDITVRAQLLDIQRASRYSFDVEDPGVTEATRLLRINHHENGKGVAHGDLNGDGYVDLVGTNSSGLVLGDYPNFDEQTGPVFVWVNGGGENHWITLRLKGRMAIDGTGTNADGIGARVYVETVSDDSAEPLRQVQEVRAGSSYLSMDSIDLEFGVGTATTVDEITVLWPSGREQVIADVAVDQVLVITEPGG